MCSGQNKKRSLVVGVGVGGLVKVPAAYAQGHVFEAPEPTQSVSATPMLYRGRETRDRRIPRGSKESWPGTH